MSIEARLEEATPFKKFDADMLIRYDYLASQTLGKDHWRVAESFKFYVGNQEDNTWVVVPANFLTDGATIPRWLWWVTPPWSMYGQAAALHDYLIEYETMFVGDQPTHVDRKLADNIFDEALVVNHVRWFPRKVMVLCVKAWTKFGRPKSAGYRAKKQLLERS